MANLKAVLIKFDVQDVFTTFQCDGYTVRDADDLLADFISISDNQVAHSKDYRQLYNQFHMVYDGWFSTVPISDTGGIQDTKIFSDYQ